MARGRGWRRGDRWGGDARRRGPGRRGGRLSPDARDASGGLEAPERLDIPFGDPLVHRLFPPLATGVHWGLERTRAALSDLGDPQDTYPTVHVGGTNGKGSVAATVHAVLRRAGLRSGLYTSPHLCSFTERYQVGSGPVAEADLVRHADAVRDVVVDRGLTFFEAMTVLGFHLLAEEGVDVGVIEVGLGGRLDATNVITPAVSAITNVAMDHAEFLGDTLAAIAREKAGIVKPGVPLVTAEQDDDLMRIFREVAEAAGAPVERVLAGDATRVRVGRDGTRFGLSSPVFGALDLHTPLAGVHQALNGALAVRVLEALPPELRPDASAVREGLAAVRWPGRDQVEEVDGHPVLFDVAHNTAGVGSLVDTLDRLDLPGPWVALVGVLGDKAWREMLPPLFRRCSAGILTQAPSAPEARRWSPRAVLPEIEEASRPARLEVEEDFGRALVRAREEAGAGTVVVTGSVYTVGSALTALGRPPWG